MDFTPLLIVNDDGSVISDRDALDKLTVTTEIVGDSTGPKIDIFKYKNKTGYRRRAGHRQKYTRLEVKKIEVPGAKKKAPADAAGAKEPVESAEKAEKAEKAKAEKAKKAKKAKADKAKADKAKADKADKAKAEKKSASSEAKTEKKEG